MELIKLIEIGLEHGGFDGLFNSLQGCACEKSDLAPCYGGMSSEYCQAGHKSAHSKTGKWVIGEKRNLTDEEVEIFLYENGD